MEESNISNSKNNICNIDSNKILLLYNTNIQNLSTNIVYCNIDEINNCEVSSFKHILIQDLLDFYNDNVAKDILLSIYKKACYGCKLEIQGIDLKQLCIAVANEDIDEQLTKDILYSRKNIHNIYDIQNYFNEVGLTIDSRKYINIFEYNITGIK